MVVLAPPGVSIGRDDRPYLYVPGTGEGSPVNTLLGGYQVCGVTSCRSANFNIFDLLKMDYDDKLAWEYDKYMENPAFEAKLWECYYNHPS